MSLVSTYVRCIDGLWYKNPLWYELAPDGGKEWFLCVDDEDPVEYVKREGSSSMPPNFISIEKGKPRKSHRMLGRNYLEMLPAESMWCRFSNVPFPPQKSDGSTAYLPKKASCFYYLVTGIENVPFASETAYRFLMKHNEARYNPISSAWFNPVVYVDYQAQPIKHSEEDAAFSWWVLGVHSNGKRSAILEVETVQEANYVVKELLLEHNKISEELKNAFNKR